MKSLWTLMKLLKHPWNAFETSWKTLKRFWNPLNIIETLMNPLEILLIRPLNSLKPRGMPLKTPEIIWDTSGPGTHMKRVRIKKNLAVMLTASIMSTLIFFVFLLIFLSNFWTPPWGIQQVLLQLFLKEYFFKFLQVKFQCFLQEFYKFSVQKHLQKKFIYALAQYFFRCFLFQNVSWIKKKTYTIY